MQEENEIILREKDVSSINQQEAETPSKHEPPEKVEKPLSNTKKHIEEKRRIRPCVICGVTGWDIPRFGFPQKLSIRQKWAEFCKMNENDIKNSYRLCGKHFCESDFFHKKHSSKRLVLKKSSIPTLIPVNPKDELRNIENIIIQGQNSFHGTNNRPNNDRHLIECVYMDTEETGSPINENDCEESTSNLSKLIDPLETVSQSSSAESLVEILDPLPTSTSTVRSSKLLSSENVDDLDDVNMNVDANTITGNHVSYVTPSNGARYPRYSYVGDFKMEDMNDPRKAKLLLDVSRRTLTSYREKLKQATRRIKALESKVTTLEEALLLLNEQTVESDDNDF